MRTRLTLALIGLAIGFFIGGSIGLVGGFGGRNGAGVFGFIGFIIGFLAGAEGNQFWKRK